MYFDLQHYIKSWTHNLLLTISLQIIHILETSSQTSHQISNGSRTRIEGEQTAGNNTGTTEKEDNYGLSGR